MHLSLLFLAIATLVGCLLAGLEITLGARKLTRLEDVPPIADEIAPAISVVIPACNEELTITRALRSVLAQDYPDFEVIAVNDRSIDGTGTILDLESTAHPRLSVVHIHELPPRWLGKNHALQKGGESAVGSLILFTDADVVMDSSVLRRAASWMESNGLDHLAIAPRARVRGFLSNAFLAVFAVAFTRHVKPWKVRDPASRSHIGIGAFNLVRATAWRQVGGHQLIAMRPDDDIKLGKLMKLRGFRQDFLIGTRLLMVEWYRSFSEMQRGLMKNLFSGAEYRISIVLVACALQITFLVWPFVAAVTANGSLRAANMAVAGILWIFFVTNAGLVGIRRWWCLALPLGSLVGVYPLLRATTLNLAQGGIEWRGTYYPLDQLRANRL